MPRGTRKPTTVLLIAMLLGSGIAAAPPKPAELPSDRDELGDAFVEAWLSLRRDMDSLSHGGTHPRLLDAWLAVAPRFLLRDLVRLSSEPQVALAAAARLADGADDEDRSLLAELEASHRGRPLAHAYWAARIRAGSAAARKQALEGVDDPRLEVRLEAARALAAAGVPKGRARLRQLLASGSEQSDEAARALGAYGEQSDLAVLAKARQSQGDGYALRAAAGELAMRRHFPDHHLALVRFDPAGLRMVTTGGLYDTWLDALGRVIRAGARTHDELAEGIEAQRRANWTEDDPEIVRRRLAALTEFLDDVKARLTASGPIPEWPADFAEAMSRIRDDGSDPAVFAARVAAAISVCAWSADRIDHRRLWPTTEGLRFITPGGARAADGNLATSFRFVAGGRIVIELDEPRTVRELWLANTCFDRAGARPTRVRVVGQDGGARWEREGRPAAGRYFQRVDLGQKTAKRIEVSFPELKGEGVSCLAELRLL